MLADVGITQIGMLIDFGSLPQTEIMRSLEIFGKEVLADVGITQIGMLIDFGSLPQTEIMRSLEIFGKEVLPHVKDL